MRTHPEPTELDLALAARSPSDPRVADSCRAGRVALGARVRLGRFGLARNLAGVVELVDTQDLGSCGLARGGSNPSARTRNYPRDNDETG